MIFFRSSLHKAGSSVNNRTLTFVFILPLTALLAPLSQCLVASALLLHRKVSSTAPGATSRKLGWEKVASVLFGLVSSLPLALFLKAKSLSDKHLLKAASDVRCKTEAAWTNSPKLLRSIGLGAIVALANRLKFAHSSDALMDAMGLGGGWGFRLGP